MRVYVETGILVDYLAQGQFSVLRSAPRRGRDPDELYNDARDVLSLFAGSAHEGGISAFTFYEIEEALYAQIAKGIKNVPNREAIRLSACRPVLIQGLAAARLFKLRILDLAERAVDAVAKSPVLTQQGVRAADGLHLMTAAHFDAELVLSADRHILKLDAALHNASGRPMRCLDTKDGLALLRAGQAGEKDVGAP